MLDNAGPAFVSPLPSALSGVDYLGLRQVNLDFIQGLLPGLNGQTDTIRPYALCCWAVFKFRQLVPRQGTFKPSDFASYEEALETLYVWSHKLHEDAAGLVGNSRQAPTGNGNVPLSFAAWGRRIGFLDATQYGPSLKTELGLGFLDAGEGYYRLNPSGEDLAEAFENVLQERGVVDRLAKLDFREATEAFAAEMYKVWSRRKATAAEVKPFLNALYAPDKVGDGSHQGNRAATINLVLHTLRLARNGGTATQVRRWMASRIISTGRPIPLEGHLAVTQRLWSVLQIRQAHRLGLEALFGWMEHELLTTHARSTEVLAHRMNDAVQAGLDSAKASSMADYLAHLVAKSQDGGLWRAGLSEPACELFGEIDATLKVLAEAPETVPWCAWRLLLLVAAHTKEWMNKGAPKGLIGRGTILRVSLAHWTEFLNGRLGDGDLLVCRQVLETYLVSQHLRVATQRAEFEKLKLRLVLEEDGLATLLPPGKDWRPRVTGDRLESVLSLLSLCRLCQFDDDSQRYVATA